MNNLIARYGGERGRIITIAERLELSSHIKADAGSIPDVLKDRVPGYEPDGRRMWSQVDGFATY